MQMIIQLDSFVGKEVKISFSHYFTILLKGESHEILRAFYVFIVLFKIIIRTATYLF
jgi:hypothetical protein